MNCAICLFVISAVVSMVQSAHPVFLEGNGAKICTLNNVGLIPTRGSTKYPVYQKVCRQVTPTLGDPINEDDGYRKSNKPSKDSNDAEIEKVRRAILAPIKKCTD